MCGGGGGGGAVKRQQEQERQRQQRIDQGKQQLDQIFSGLTGGNGKDPIWAQQQQAYMDFATPQLQDQYGMARRDLASALARQGQLSGSVAGDQWARLNKKNQLNQQAIADKAHGYANQAKQNVADERQQALSMLESTADPSAAAQSAHDSLVALSATPNFSTLGPLFQNVTAGLAAGAQGNAQYNTAQKVKSIYGGNPDTSSGRVVG